MATNRAKHYIFIWLIKWCLISYISGNELGVGGVSQTKIMYNVPSGPGNPINPLSPASPFSPTEPSNPFCPNEPLGPGKPSLPIKEKIKNKNIQQ